MKNEAVAYAESTAPRPADEKSSEDEVRELISRSQAGDKAAFANLYRMHVNAVYRYLSYRLRDTSTAEDLTAEVFVRVLKKIGDFEWRGIDFNAWLLRIARNILLDHLKSSGSRLEVVGIPEDHDSEGSSFAPGSDLEALDSLDRQDLYKALGQLRPEHQEVLYLRFLQGLSSIETAQAMNKSEGAIRVLQFRALKHLLKTLRTEEALQTS